MRLFLLLFFFALETIGQSDRDRKSHISIFFGDRRISNQGVLSNLDPSNFFNYLETSTKEPSYYNQLGIDFRYGFKKNDFINFYISTYDDLVPRNFEIEYAKFFFENIGLSAAIGSYGLSFSGFPDKLPEDNLDNFKFNTSIFFNFGANSKYVELDQFYFLVRPFYQYNNKFLRVETKFNLGVGRIQKMNIFYYFESENTFEKARVFYKYKTSPYFVFMPELRIAYFPIKCEKGEIGIETKLNYSSSKRYYKYDKEIANWTEENFRFLDGGGSKSTIQKLEYSVGLIYSF